MKNSELIIAIILLALAGFLLVLAIRHFLQRGFLLNNAYIYATPKERERMDKRPYYRQSAVVFSFLSAVFVAVSLSLLLQNDKLLLLEIPLFVGVLVYAIVSTVQIERAKKKK